MARTSTGHPTELELEILKIIWRDGPCTARQVRDRLAATRDLAFTSVLTIMNIMVRKGTLTSERRSRAVGGTIYTAKVAQAPTASQMLHHLARRLFGGSIATAIQNLFHAGELSKAELKELREIVGEPKQRKRG